MKIDNLSKCLDKFQTNYKKYEFNEISTKVDIDALFKTISLSTGDRNDLRSFRHSMLH
jgi:hypothetical protein